MIRHSLLALLAMLAGTACTRATPTEAVKPVDVTRADAAASSESDAATTGTSTDASSGGDTKSTVKAGAYGGLWVNDATGQPVGVLVQRGHPSLSTGNATDILRDGAIVYAPQAGVFIGVQLSTGKIISPRLGVSDGTCATPVVAGYYTDGDAVSGPDYAFVYNGLWYRIEAYKPLQLVSCGGTVADGIDGKCAPHAGSCRGFPVKSFASSLPTQFAGPLQIGWVAP